MCRPSPEPSLGAGICTEVPVVQVVPLSVLYWVDARPLPVSVPEKVRVTGSLLQAPSRPETEVVGGAASMFTVALLKVSTLPAASVER